MNEKGSNHQLLKLSNNHLGPYWIHYILTDLRGVVLLDGQVLRTQRNQRLLLDDDANVVHVFA